MLQTDELLQQIGCLERANRFWKRLAFGLGAALFLFLALGAGIGISLYMEAANREAEAEVIRTLRLQVEEELIKAAEKTPW